MSVLIHLQDTVAAVKITDTERLAIDISISNLSSKLSSYFSNINTQFVFGSYDRKTILRRSKDSNSDVDYMVVFIDGDSYKPQTLMTRLKAFAEYKYSRSEIYQSSPTIVLELDHIKFELAPAYVNWGTYYIPAPASSYIDWISTNPGGMKYDLDVKHKNNYYLIRDLILLLKYWNVKNDKVYTSYELEKYVLNKTFMWCCNLKDYFYSAVEDLPTFSLPAYKSSKVAILKQIILNTKSFESQSMLFTAETEIKKAI